MIKMIKAEVQNLFHNHILLLSISVICLLPFLYSIFFLKSVWDPYGSTQDLPIAVVNRDVPVEYQGKKMAVGQQTVDQLRKNHQMKWEIVSKKKADYGLHHRQYYAVITIPQNFSENATTVMDKNPKQMKLHYETNGSLNYIGQVMTEIGTSRLNISIRSQVTQAYAKAMFKELGVVGKGMTKAADGAHQLSDGIVTLNDGVNQYVAGVYQVNNGVQQMKVAVTPLASGAQQLANGSSQLAAGIQQYTGGVGQLASGLGLLQSNSGQLSGGAGQLAAGLNTLNGRSAELQSGAGQLAAGSTELNNKVSGMIPGLQQQLGSQSTTIMAQANELQRALAPVAQTPQQLKEVSSQLGAISTTLGSVKNQLESNSGQASSTPASANNSQQLQAALAALNGAQEKDENSQNQINSAKSAIQAAMNNASNNTTPAKSGSQDNSKVIAEITAVQSGVDKLKSTIDASASSATASSQKIESAAAALEATLKGMDATTSATLGSASAELQGATGALAAGANKLNTGVNAYTGGVATAAAGANTLNAGIGQYTAGVAQAGAGANQLVANSPALISGAGQLASALAQLNAQMPSLISGINLLAAGTQQLADNSPALISGITQLNDGASQLASQLGKGAKTINGIKPTGKTAKMFAEPTTVKHKNYSYVPNYGHALAPYVLSVALYVGILVFNFIYPIRRVAEKGHSAVAWWASKVFVGAVAVTLMAVIEDAIMLACGLTTDHIPSLFATSICFGLASMAIVMFLSMTFDNPGRFVAMVLLMLQLGGSGGTFPMQVTMKFYNVIHWYLPMTYSILGLRQSISSGIGAHYALFCNLVLLGIAVVFNLLLLAGMLGIHHHFFNINPKLEKNQEFLDEMENNGGIQSKKD
ncbi:YhgE/Pip domain-containing protein [Limosilactobacillus oris]|uniref:YhgE/Pip domain protein n=1 Tax=Limosilactobacillus oris PB013-T2-3 TaxID=908339 RepID=E3C854_9LACO|nr:YhgE/Pip domain-containing protein [Limosilactobacillus oris]EFQ53112.1 YhgE/Pip domain protein [Limosilactobacillus oris PB013-T2-3]